MLSTLSVLNSFFVNLSILFTVMTLLFLPYRHQPHITLDSSLTKRFTLGVGSGLIATLLMFNSLSIHGVLIDLRVIPVIIAVLFGGWVSGVVATLLFWSIRILVVENGNFFPFYLSVISLLGFLIPALLVRPYVRRPATALATFAFFGCISFGAAIYIALPLRSFFVVYPVYAAMTIIGTYLTYKLWIELQRHFDNMSTQKRLARTDTLTGIANRRKLDEALANLTVTASEYALILVDIDHFKQVNDTHGHDVGDDVLRSLGTLLVQESGPDALVGRFGGEEFLVVLPHASKIEVARLSERLREIVAHYAFPTKIGNLHITISLGACHSRDIEVDSVLKHADEALYQAKQTGRNRSVISA